MEAVAWLPWLWLLLATVSAGVIRAQEDQVEPCQTYTLNNVVYLDCSDRGLVDLPEGLDYNAHVLLLANNNFETFPPLLQNFLQVQTLDLSGNSLTRPLPSYMGSWTSLQTLNLSNNNYDSWPSNEHTYHMKRLDLSRNKINNIDEDAFTRTPQLFFLDLSENRIYDLPPGLFTHASNLGTLILSRNYFSEVPSFRSPSLRNIYLSNCQITRIDVNSLTGMNSLLELDLSINEIENIPDNLASNTLQELDLSYNEISTLTDRTFSLLPHLAVLDLRGNEFKEVWSTSHFASNPFLREVHVKGNRWSCEGFSVNLLLTFEYLTKEPSKVTDRGSLICYSPSNVTHLSWQQAYILTWHVESSTNSYTMMAVLVGVIIGILITSFVCRGIMVLNKPDPPRPTSETTVLNANGSMPQERANSVIMRVPLREDLPPSYDEALLMPRLNASFHSLPDFVDEPEETSRRYRRSRSIGDLTEFRPRTIDRRSVRRTVEIHIT